jgi:hypothetical protein
MAAGRPGCSSAAATPIGPDLGLAGPGWACWACWAYLGMARLDLGLI